MLVGKHSLFLINFPVANYRVSDTNSKILSPPATGNLSIEIKNLFVRIVHAIFVLTG